MDVYVDMDGYEDEANLVSMEAALAAASWTSRAEHEAGLGNTPASSGKFRIAPFPLTEMAAASWALAAISGVAKVPSQIRDFFRGSRISDTHFPHARIRTPRNTGCLLLSLTRFFWVGSGSAWSGVGGSEVWLVLDCVSNLERILSGSVSSGRVIVFFVLSRGDFY